MANPGRRSKCTQKTIETIAKFLAGGAFFEPACKAAGISPSAAYSWLEQARKSRDGALEDPPIIIECSRLFLEFLEAYELADAEAEVAASLRLRIHGERSPAALEGFMKRRWPDRWGDRVKQEGPAGGPEVTLNQVIINIVKDLARADLKALPEEGVE